MESADGDPHGGLDNMKVLLKGHKDTTGESIDRAGDLMDEATRGKYGEQVDAAQEKLKGQLSEKEQEGNEDTPPQA